MKRRLTADSTSGLQLHLIAWTENTVECNVLYQPIGYEILCSLSIYFENNSVGYYYALDRRLVKFIRKNNSEVIFFKYAAREILITYNCENDLSVVVVNVIGEVTQMKIAVQM